VASESEHPRIGSGEVEGVLAALWRIRLESYPVHVRPDEAEASGLNRSELAIQTVEVASRSQGAQNMTVHP
jgi:hypothetical protein